MTESWVTRPKLDRRCMVRIFNTRKNDPFPWVLVLPASPTIDSKRKVIRYPDWQTAWLVAMSIQDQRNRNAP